MITILNRKEVIADLDHKAVYLVEDALKERGIETYSISKMSRIGTGGFETHLRVLHLYVSRKNFKKAKAIIDNL